MEECALALEVLADVPRPVSAPRGPAHRRARPIADMERLEDSGADCEETALPPWEHALPIFSVGVRVHPPRPLRRAPRRVLARPAAQAGSRLRAARRRLSRALGRGRRLAAALRARAALRRARLPHADVRPAARRGGGDAGLSRPRHGRVRPFNWLGWPSATTRDGVLFSGRSDATVLAAALAWERELPPPTIY